MTLKQHKMAKIIICKKYVLKICAILDNFGAGEGFSMKTDNTDANKIPPSFFAMFFCSVFFNPPKKDPKMAKIQIYFFPSKNNR